MRKKKSVKIIQSEKTSLYIMALSDGVNLPRDWRKKHIQECRQRKNAFLTFKVLQDVPFPEGECLFKLLIQHAVNRYEALVQSNHVWETHGCTNYVLRPLDWGALGDALSVSKHPCKEWERERTTRMTHHCHCTLWQTKSEGTFYLGVIKAVAQCNTRKASPKWLRTA